LLSNFLAYSQNNIDRIILEINNNLKTYAADPKIKNVYINRIEKILDIQEYQIPLNFTTVSYKNKSRIYSGLKTVGDILFKCEQNQIIDKKNDFVMGVSFAYKSKEGAYKLIELIYLLNKELDNK
jgi:hypothetical protein